MSFHNLINMIIVTYIFVLVQFSGAINDYNYVLERYSIQPSSRYVLKSKLCRLFNLLSICDEYNRNNWNKLESYSNSLKRRQVFINKWRRNENIGQCECKCCSCPKPSKIKNRKLYSKLENYEQNLPSRHNKFKEQKHFYMPLVRQKYKTLQKRRRNHAKRFDINNIVHTVKDTAKTTYEKAEEGFKKGLKNVEDNAIQTYERAEKCLEKGLETVENGVVNTYRKVDKDLKEGLKTVEDSALHTYENALSTVIKAERQVEEAYKDVKIATGIEAETCTYFLNKINTKLEVTFHDNMVAQWNYEADLSETNRYNSIIADTNFAKKFKEISEKVKTFDKKYSCSSVDSTMSRQISLLTKLQELALLPENYEELQNIVKHMESMFSKATIKDYNDCSSSLHLEPGISNRMTQSRDPVELEYIWESWRNETGRKFKMFYPRYVVLMNRAAKLNGFCNAAEMWLSVYQQDDFEEDIFKVWEQIKPLYQKLHAYVRQKLLNFYGNTVVTDAYIPAHLLGNVFGQAWMNLYNLTMPFPNQTFPDITSQLQAKGYTPLKMFQEAENFFKSLDLPPMTKEFWKNSILEPKPEVEMVCHASAWDMYDQEDFRIKMCTHVTFEDFTVIHHEMGHIEYYMLYKNLPVVFREGANPGFHEAIGDTIALSVSSPGHIKSLGLQVENEDNYSSNINFLFFMALQKIAFLPYALVVESWRWGVFRGDITIQNYNEHWWYFRKKYQGVKPPKLRSEDNFDPGSKYHIAAGVPYIRYFVSFVIQFQFHEALCRKAGKLEHDSDSLHKCDIYKSKEAGDLLKEVLSLGKSEPWSEIMLKFTGKNKISAKSLLKYFEPLERWLESEIEKHNINIGWEFNNNY